MKTYAASLVLTTSLFATASFASDRPGKAPATNKTADAPSNSEDNSVEGGLGKKDVQTVIRSNLKEVRHCYETQLQIDPKVKGKVRINFKILADGSVGQVNTVLNETIPESMQTCINGKIALWKFPQPRGGKVVDVVYPFVFNPM